MSKIVQRGEIWIAKLDPTEGSEQAGIRPVIVFQNNLISKFSSTVLTIPFTTNLRRASLPTCLLIPAGNGGLKQDSVALCYQLRVLDKRRLQKKLGKLNPEIITQLEAVVLTTLGY